MHASKFFDAIARRYDRVYALDARTSRGRMARVLAELPPAARVLDLGVGTGRELPALLDAGHRPIGLDASAEMLALCARRARPIPLVHADFWEPLPFDDAAFDAVLALHGSLAHPPSNPAKLPALAREIARVLVPGGVFVGEAPSPGWLARVAADQTRDARESDRRIVQVAEGRFVYEDLVVGARIEASPLDEAGWRRMLDGFDVRIEPLDPDELFVVARRR